MSTDRKPIVVCKIGGSVIDGVNPSIVDDVRALRSKNYDIIFVHGGGDKVTEIAQKLGKEQRFITSPDGIKSRFTDKDTAEIFTMVMSGMLAKQISQTLQKSGINSITLTGIDGLLLKAERKKRLVILDERGRKIAIEGGYTGKITSVNTSLLDTLLSVGLVPIVSPVAVGDEFELLNVDGDRACSHIAGAVKADASLFLTDTEGLILNGEVVSNLTLEQAKTALPSIGSGMDKKVIAASEAVEMGAKRSVIASGLKDHPLQNALDGKGTVIQR